MEVAPPRMVPIATGIEHSQIVDLPKCNGPLAGTAASFREVNSFMGGACLMAKLSDPETHELHTQGLRRCSKCRCILQETQFHAAKTGSFGLHSWCIACCRDRGRAYYQAHKEWWVQRRAADLEHHNKICRDSYARHRMRLRAEALARHYAADPEEKRKRWARRRMRERAAGGAASTEKLQQRAALYGYRCWICGQLAPKLEMDHVKPTAAGGSNYPCNRRPCCPSCNSSKYSTWPFPAPPFVAFRAALPPTRMLP